MTTTTTRFRVSRDEEPGIPKIDNVRVSPEDVRAGSTFTIGYTLRNEGEGPMTGTATIKFDCTGAVCIPPKRMNERTIQAKGSTPETAQFTMPQNATPGTYAVTINYEQKNNTTRPTPGYTPPTRPTTFQTKTTLS